MKILILANPDNYHTIKWVNSLSEQGIEICLFGLNNYDKNLLHKNVTIEIFDAPLKSQKDIDGSISKIIYLASLKRLKNFIRKVKPDILHAHYVSSYGLLGALTGFHPFFISVWGRDIYDIPEKNVIYKKLVRYGLDKADMLFSTSNAMALQTKKFTNKLVEVIPFGIDINKYKPMKVDTLFNKDDIVIGTVKTLEKKYGIEYLIRTFKLIKEKLPAVHLKLLIVGTGILENHLKTLVKELGLENDAVFTGFIVPEEVPKYHNMLDIYAALSIEDSESFGVSVLEASACEKPVVVSDVSGFKEVVANNISGFIVERKNIDQTADVIIKLIADKKLREEIGSAGRKHVEQFYNWEDNLSKMISTYKQFA